VRGLLDAVNQSNNSARDTSPVTEGEQAGYRFRAFVPGGAEIDLVRSAAAAVRNER
jgi:hypothetical protein